MRYLSMALTSSTIAFQALQFSFMIQGSTTQLMFEIIWFLIVLVYPVGSLTIMASPVVEQYMLTDQFWAVYISAALYSLLTLENYDLIDGEAADALKITCSTLVQSMTLTSTILSSLTVASNTIYSWMAAETYLDAIAV